MSLSTDSDPEPDPRSGWAGVLRRPDFLKLWVASTVSVVGNHITLLALPLVAIGVLHASAFEVALLGALELLPMLFLSLFAGVWIDRLHRRRLVMIGADLGRAVSLLSLPVASVAGVLGMPQVYLVALVNGTLRVLFDIAYQAYLPSVVERRELIDANAKLELGRSTAQLGGPGLAGVLIGALTAPLAIVIDAVSFLGSAGLLALIRKGEPQAPRSMEGAPRPILSEIAEGLRFVLKHPLLAPVTATSAIGGLSFGIGMSIFLVYAVRVLGLTPELIGLVYALGSIGALAGATITSWLTDRLGVGRTILIGAAMSGPSMLLIPLAPASFPLPYLVLAELLFGLYATVYGISQLSLRQAVTPEHLQGRMNASVRFVVWGVGPIGYVMGGAIGETLGLTAALWIGTVGAFIAPLPVILSRIRDVDVLPNADVVERGPVEAGDEQP
jgi:MFS family permease